MIFRENVNPSYNPYLPIFDSSTTSPSSPPPPLPSIIRSLEIAKESGYEPQEVLRQGRPEEIEAEIEEFRPLLIVKIDYDVREYDVVVLGLLK